METFLIRALQFILSLSILVVLHEFGHFGFARLFRIRVDKFYMFFNPKFSILRAKKVNGKWRFKFFAKNVPANERVKLDSNGNMVQDENNNYVMESVPLSEMSDNDWRKYPETTEWGIGWLPLGGYCKISGMIDESMDKTQMTEGIKPWEFRSRSVWQRLPVMIGGVLVNFILALIIYSAVLFTWGREYVPLANAEYGLNYPQAMLNAGFHDGDKIVSIDGKVPKELGDAVEAILIDYGKNIVVEREGKQLSLTMPEDLTQKILESKKININYRCPYVVDGVIAGSGAEKAKLQKGDSIVAVNGKPMSIIQDVIGEIESAKGYDIELTFIRNGMQMEQRVSVDGNGKIGTYIKSPANFLKTEKNSYGIAQSIPAGMKMGVETLGGYIKQFKLVFTKEGAKSIGGFGSIGKLFPPVWDWHSFWLMTAFLSVILAFMNILPIPGLDGGYVLFLIYEMITGRKPSDKFLEYAVTAGMVLLFALLIYANGNDLYRAIFN